MISADTDSPTPRTDTAGGLSAGLLDQLRGSFSMDERDRACHNAVTNNPINALALNRGVLRKDDGHFSHRIKSKGITNQERSGRCWMFAALNVLRPRIIRDHRMAEFEFSTAYLQFWDKLEKANLFLESVLELREADYLDRDWEVVTKWTLGDGGWWNYAAGLIEKYGVVPRSVMPETHSSTHTDTLNEILGRLVRSRAAKLLEHHRKGAPLSELRTSKEDALQEIYRLLALNLGEPPTEFDWRYRHTRKTDNENPDAKMEMVREDDLTGHEHHTPQSFAQQYIGHPLSDFVCLYNDPKSELDRHYHFDRSTNIAGGEPMHFVNIGMAPMKEIARDSILANQPLWFAVNMGFDQSEKHGLMDHQLFDYEALFGVDLDVNKADRSRFHADMAGHAMTLMGVDLDADNRPRKWLVENSWGKDKGEDGCWTLHDEWFDEHVYTIIAHRSHVPEDILRRFKDEPVTLPAWYPGASGTH